MTAKDFTNRVAWRAYRTVFGEPAPDPTVGWRGTAGEGLDVIRVLHLGDCGLRAMENGHDFRAPLGYPVVAAERLLEHGVGMEFSRWFALRFEDLPPLKTLTPHMKLSGPPDIVLLQVGAAYFRRVITIEGPITALIRDELSRRFGRGCYASYAILRPLTRAFGHRKNDYHGTEALERFLVEARTAWPDATFALIFPYRGQVKLRAHQRLADRLVPDMIAAARRTGTEIIRFHEQLGTDLSLRCANRYNLNARGSEVVGEELARWMLAHRSGRPDDARQSTA